MSDPDIALDGTEFTVSATEKVSTGDYETYDAHTTISGEIDMGDHELDADARKALRARLLSLHKDVQETVERSCANRLKLDGGEDWGVYPDRE